MEKLAYKDRDLAQDAGIRAVNEITGGNSIV